MTFVTGERLQMLADVFIGEAEDFAFNPVIAGQKAKQLALPAVPPMYLNPRVVFCHTHRLGAFVSKLRNFLRPFVLLTHNSDGNVTEQDPVVQTLLQSPKVLRWYAQNANFTHPKLRLLPIGLANGQWAHGVACWQQVWPLAVVQQAIEHKPERMYCCFNVSTNPGLRQPCAQAMQRLGVPVLPLLSPDENIKRMAAYKFVICPAGNGFDTHRLWECWYLKCVPIVVDTPFIQTLQRALPVPLPLVVLADWQDLTTLSAGAYAELLPRFASLRPFLTLEHYADDIRQ